MGTAVKQMSHKAYSPSFNAEVRNEWSYVSIPRGLGKSLPSGNHVLFILCTAVSYNFMKHVKK